MMALDKITASLHIILPEIMLIVGLIGLVIVATFETRKSNIGYYYSLFLVLGYFYYSNHHYAKILHQVPSLSLFSGMIYIDKASLIFKELITFSVLIFLVHFRVFDYKFKTEILVLIFHIFLGLVFLSMTTHFLMVYVGIELVSIASYMLVASANKKTNFEAAIKYLIFGATTSAIMLYGISLFYGVSHNLNFADIANNSLLKTNNPALVQVVVFMILAGMFFKTAASPFHNWVPDVYEVTQTPILSFLSFAPKAIVILLISRFIYFIKIDLMIVLFGISILSLLIGNFAALWQENIKRMLGYSGIAQIGFIIIGLLNHENNHFQSAYFYAVAYLPITMGSFFLVDILYKTTGSYILKDFSGLGKNNAVLSINSVIIMAALIGLPPTVGFLAKIMIFTSITPFQTSHSALFYGLILFGLLNAGVSIYYYIKLPYYIIVKKNKTDNPIEINPILYVILSVFSFIIIYLFFFPDMISNMLSQISFG